MQSYTFMHECTSKITFICMNILSKATFLCMKGDFPLTFPEKG